MDSSSTLKCSKLGMSIDKEQDFHFSFQPNVINHLLIIIVKHNIPYRKYILLIVNTYLENHPRSNVTRSPKCKH